MPVEDAAGFWDRQAATFDNEPDHGMLDPVVRGAWHDLLVAVLPAPPADVADIGCGTGSVSVLLAEAGYRVLGLDSSHAMIAVAKTKAEAHRAVNAAFFVGDGADPALAASSVDAIVVRHVAWALPNPQQTIKRWARLLRDRGVLVMVEGCWSTGAGITEQELSGLVRSVLSMAETRTLLDDRLWGGPITDERYMLVAHK